MTNIHGRLTIAYLTGSPIFCGTDSLFSTETEAIEATTMTSNGWKEYRPRKVAWSLQVSGLTKIDSSDGQIDYFSLISTGALNPQDVTIDFEDEEGNIRTIEGVSSYISDSNITGDADANCIASVTFLGDGPYSLTGS